MSCPPRPDPAVHLPPGIFHTRHIAGDQSLRNKCSTSPPLKGTIPKMAKKKEKKRWTPDRKSWAEHGSSYQFNVLFQCALDRVHPSIHPAPFHRSGIPFSPQTVTHGRSGKVSVRKERNRERTLLRWEQLRDQTNTWRRLTTQELASPGGEPPDRHFSPSRQGTNVKRDGIKPKLPVGTVKIKAQLQSVFHFYVCLQKQTEEHCVCNN